MTDEILIFLETVETCLRNRSILTEEEEYILASASRILDEHDKNNKEV